MGSAFCLIPGLAVFVAWFPVLPVVMCERVAWIGAFKRAWELAEGAYGPLLGLVVIVWGGDFLLSLSLTSAPWMTTPTQLAVVTAFKAVLVEPFKAMALVSAYVHLLRSKGELVEEHTLAGVFE